jgi:hypothetical protein
VASAGARGRAALCRAAWRRAGAGDRRGGGGDAAGAGGGAQRSHAGRIPRSPGGPHRGPLVGRPTLCRALRRLGLWRKKTLRANERDRADLQAERAVFCERVRQLDPRELVFIDETGITTAMTRLYAGAPRGHTARPRAAGDG